MGEMGRMLSVVDVARVVVETFEVPEPRPGEVLVRVNRTQVSAGSEKGRFRGASPPDPKIPLGYWEIPPGYTAAGRVQAIGPGVEGFEIGDRVFASGRHASHLLSKLEDEDDGGMRKRVQRIEFDVTDEQACFSRLGDVALHSIRRAELQPDESVAIFGQGVVGQLIAAFARISGAYPIIAIDLDGGRLELSKNSPVGSSHDVISSRYVRPSWTRPSMSGQWYSHVAPSGDSVANATSRSSSVLRRASSRRRSALDTVSPSSNRTTIGPSPFPPAKLAERPNTAPHVRGRLALTTRPVARSTSAPARSPSTPRDVIRAASRRSPAIDFTG